MFWTVTYRLLIGFKTTFQLFAVTLVLSLPLGLVISFGSMSKFRPLRYLTKTFIWIIRGVPLLLQIFIVFYVPAFLYGIRFPRFAAAAIAMTINYACYFSEIFRGGIESISHSQYEAGQVLGMTKTQIFFRVIFLQVIKRITAPMSNEFINLVKDTSLARIIMVAEVFKAAEDFMNTQAIIWPLFYTAVFYLAAVGLLTLMFGHAEKRLSYFRA
jgi:polar amino acid transport system permease protein